MKTFLPRLALVASMLALPLFGRAAVPATLGFVARIADQGQPVSGSHDFTFTLWNDLTASDTTNQLWTEAQTGLTVNDGVVVATLGATTAIDPAAVFAGGTVYLEIAYDGVALSPRLQVVSVPYAMVAGSLATPPTLDCKNETKIVTLDGGGACCTARLCPSVTVCGATCADGYSVTGGGFDLSTDTTWTLSHSFSSGNSWSVHAKNTGAVGNIGTVTTIARCCRIP